MNQHPSFEFRGRLENQLAAWGLPRDLAAEIESHCTPVTYEKGAVIFLRGTPADLVFWLFKGFIKLYLPHPNGDRTLITVARPGDPLGTVESVDSNGRHLQILEAHALTKCSVGLLSREQLVKVLRKLEREVVLQLLVNLNSIWSSIFERYTGFIGLPFRERLETVLKDLATRFGIKDNRGILIVPELSQEDLAEMIGSSRPMVSKLVADMTQEGLLVRGGSHHFILRDEPPAGGTSPVDRNAKEHAISLFSATKQPLALNGRLQKNAVPAAAALVRANQPGFSSAV